MRRHVPTLTALTVKDRWYDEAGTSWGYIQSTIRAIHANCEMPCNDSRTIEILSNKADQCMVGSKDLFLGTIRFRYISIAGVSVVMVSWSRFIVLQ